MIRIGRRCRAFGAAAESVSSVPAACLRRVAGPMIGVAAACGMATRHTRSEVTNITTPEGVAAALGSSGTFGFLVRHFTSPHITSPT